jgi:hypothetical protein
MGSKTRVRSSYHAALYLSPTSHYGEITKIALEDICGLVIGTAKHDDHLNPGCVEGLCGISRARSSIDPDRAGFHAAQCGATWHERTYSISGLIVVLWTKDDNSGWRAMHGGVLFTMLEKDWEVDYYRAIPR